LIINKKGVSNIKLRIQLPIIVPEGSCCEIRVENETRKYVEGDTMVFDDSYDHEVKHYGDNGDRVVLLIDIYHPDLNKEEIDFLNLVLN
jgi:aspartate beta-hydroxylase